MVLLVVLFYVFFFFKQKTAYEMRISDWSSDVCSSDLGLPASYRQGTHHLHLGGAPGRGAEPLRRGLNGVTTMAENLRRAAAERCFVARERSEEHTSELQSLMRISYAVFCLKKKIMTSIDKNITMQI